MSIDSLAFCLDADRSALRRWAKQGVMPKPLKVGGRTLWDWSHLIERVWENAREVFGDLMDVVGSVE